MSNEIKHTVDRTGWPSGPWDSEPDRVEWRMSEPPGYPLLIVRNHFGSLCGYVGVPSGHPAHGKEWDADVVMKLDVHGGVTYGGRCQGAICHVPAPGDPDDVWWIGFDAGHAFDYTPGLKAHLDALGVAGKPAPYVEPPQGTAYAERYRDLAYMRAEVEQLAAQLARLAKEET